MREIVWVTKENVEIYRPPGGLSSDIPVFPVDSVESVIRLFGTINFLDDFHHKMFPTTMVGGDWPILEISNNTRDNQWVIKTSEKLDEKSVDILMSDLNTTQFEDFMEGIHIGLFVLRYKRYPRCLYVAPGGWMEVKARAKLIWGNTYQDFAAQLISHRLSIGYIVGCIATKHHESNRSVFGVWPYVYQISDNALMMLLGLTMRYEMLKNGMDREDFDIVHPMPIPAWVMLSDWMNSCMYHTDRIWFQESVVKPLLLGNFRWWPSNEIMGKLDRYIAELVKDTEN